MIYVVIATTKERRGRLQKCIDAVKESTIPHSIVIYENMDGGCVLATKKAIEGIHSEVFLLNDDMIVAPNCLEMLKNTYDSNFPNKDGVCQPDDNIHGGRLCTSPYCHTDVLRPFLANYRHHYWDTEFTDVMTMKNKYLIVPQAFLDHQHYTVGRSDIDNTYAGTNRTFRDDMKIYEERKKYNFADRFTQF
jgi:hypothetical protein